MSYETLSRNVEMRNKIYEVIDMFVPYELSWSLLGSVSQSLTLSVPKLPLIRQPNCQKVKVPSDWSLSVQCREAGTK